MFPHYHVIAGHLALEGEVRQTRSSDARNIQALAVTGKTGTRVWLSNQSGEQQSVRLEGVPESGEMLALDEHSFATACRDADWRANAKRKPFLASEPVILAPYAVAEFRFAS